jgi:hypothetical protein
MKQRMTTPSGCPLLWVVVLAAGLATPTVAAVRADVDRKQVYVGDTVTLVIESTNPAASEPDLSVLQQDFEILGTGSSSRFSMVNGRSSSLRSWRVRLRPLRMGELTIPVLHLGNEKTQALTVSVSDVPALTTTSGDAPALIELSIDADGPVYVQQQIALTVRLYSDQRVVDGTLDPLRIKGAVVEPLGLERRYAVSRNGRQYRVSERRYAIAAERRGQLVVPALDFRGKLAPLPSGSGSVQPFRVSSEPLEIDIQPPAMAGDHWIPAQQLTLHDSWAGRPPTPRRGEPIDRVITLQATGLNGSQLPILQLTAPSGTRIYPGRQVNDTRADSSHLYGISRQTFTYVPGETGNLAIPPVTVDWWNTTTQQPASAQIAGLSLQVMPTASSSTGADRRYTGEQSTATTAVEPGQKGMPKWLWLLIGTGMLIALFSQRRRLIELWHAASRHIQVARRIGVQQPPDHSMPPVERPSIEPAAAVRRKADGIGDLLSRLEAACRRNDARASALALLALGRARWATTPPTNLRDLAERLQQGRNEIDALDRILYGNEQESWDGAALWAVIAGVDWQADGKTPGGNDQSLIPPLYPQNV